MQILWSGTGHIPQHKDLAGVLIPVQPPFKFSHNHLGGVVVSNLCLWSAWKKLLTMRFIMQPLFEQSSNGKLFVLQLNLSQLIPDFTTSYSLEWMRLEWWASSLQLLLIQVCTLLKWPLFSLLWKERFWIKWGSWLDGSQVMVSLLLEDPFPTSMGCS